VTLTTTGFLVAKSITVIVQPRNRGDNRAGDVAEGARHDFVCGEFAAICAAAAPGAELVAALISPIGADFASSNLTNWERSGAAPCLWNMDGDVFARAEGGCCNRDGAAGGIDSAHQSTHSMSLPFFALVGLLLRNVHLLHRNKRGGQQGLAVLRHFPRTNTRSPG